MDNNYRYRVLNAKSSSPEPNVKVMMGNIALRN